MMDGMKKPVEACGSLSSAVIRGDLFVVQQLVHRFNRDGIPWSTVEDTVRQLFCPAHVHPLAAPAVAIMWSGLHMWRLAAPAGWRHSPDGGVSGGPPGRVAPAAGQRGQSGRHQRGRVMAPMQLLSSMHFPAAWRCRVSAACHGCLWHFLLAGWRSSRIVPPAGCALKG
jgi:hypothetical protein